MTKVPPNTGVTPPTDQDTLAGKTIIFLVSEDWYFLSHRLPLAREAMRRGARVIVACNLGSKEQALRATGVEVAAIPFARSGRDPFADLRALQAITDLYRRERPDIVHQVAMKPVLYGSIAARRAHVPNVINAMAGLGFLFISNGLFARIVRPVIGLAFRFLMNQRNSTLIVQNPDDEAMFRDRIGVAQEHIVIVPGSGVDTDHYTQTAKPERDTINAVCVSRMLWDKGIGELEEAARILRDRKVPVRIRLVGPADRNPASIPEDVLKQWAMEGNVEVAGPSSDIAAIYRDADIAVLPSYREGLPKSLLEAAACGLPIVATDVPGCREICVDQVTGLLVPARDAAALADALEQLTENPEMREAFGRAARRAAETTFSETAIVAQTMALYHRVGGE